MRMNAILDITTRPLRHRAGRRHHIGITTAVQGRFFSMPRPSSQLACMIAATST